MIALVCSIRTVFSYASQDEILVNDQLDAQILSYIYVYFRSLHVSSTFVLIIRRDNCTNTNSGIYHSV